VRRIRGDIAMANRDVHGGSGREARERQRPPECPDSGSRKSRLHGHVSPFSFPRFSTSCAPRMDIRALLCIFVLLNLFALNMAGARVKCSCCGKLVDEHTERRHRGLQAPVATLASSPYIAAYRERRRLGLHPARVKSRAKRPLVLAPIPEISDEEDGGPPIHPTPPDGLSSDEDEEEVHVDIQTAIDNIIRAARVPRQASESDEDLSDSDSDSDESQTDESEAGNEEMDEMDEDIDIWDIIDEMIIQEAARAFTYARGAA
jgi:hypothetical protein